MAGVFDGLPEDYVTPGDSRRLGLLAELIERFGAVLRLRSLGVSETAEMFRRALEPMGETFEAFGYTLETPAETLRFAAQRLRTSTWGPRSAVGLLTLATEQALIELLEHAAPTGTRVTLTPDDISMTVIQRRDPPGGSEPDDTPWVGA